MVEEPYYRCLLEARSVDQSAKRCRSRGGRRIDRILDVAQAEQLWEEA